jgi:pyruvate,water dikinase
VLVTRQTDPGWAPVFCLVSGLVIRRRHVNAQRVIAREFGLPCRSSRQDAASLIRTARP